MLKLLHVPTRATCQPAPELRAYILALEGRAAADQKQIGALQQRVLFLEDQFRLAQLKRFAPSSEKLGAQGLPVQRSRAGRCRLSRQ